MLNVLPSFSGLNGLGVNSSFDHAYNGMYVLGSAEFVYWMYVWAEK